MLPYARPFPPSEEDPPPRRRAPQLSPLLFSSFRAAARGVYRIFNPAQYRFYWSGTPPVAGTTPQATNSTLAYTSGATFADGTWYVSVSFFNGVLDSGFLPIGPNGQTYLTLVISSGVILATAPSPPAKALLNVLAGGVIQIVASYNALPDANPATTWAIAYTTNGSTPPSGSPTITRAMGRSPTQMLGYNLPAQANGTTVKVQLQTFNGSQYSAPLTVLSAVASTTGPTQPLGLQSWPGVLPAGTGQ